MTGRPSRHSSPARFEGPPGPGQYKVGGEKAIEGPKFGFGTSSRGSLIKTPGMDTPGPGQYKIPSKISDLPSFAMPN